MIPADMATVDPEQEHHRLTQFYAGMSEGELRKLAEDAASLTDVARQALESEAMSRGLNIAVNFVPVDELDLRELVTIRKFRDLPEALLAKGSLESAGIECFLLDDNMVRLDWFISNLIGGIKLQVNLEDAKVASEVLNEPVPDVFDVEGVGSYKQPRCPKCQSLNIAFEELNKSVAYTSAYLGLPIPLKRRSWRCNSCGVRWQDTDPVET
jgi:hypothetical protein